MRPGPDAIAEIRDLTKGRGVDVVLDLVGADATLALAAAVVRPLGHLTIVGIAGGTLPVSFFGIPYEASVATTYWGSMPELAEVVALAAAGHIRAHTQRFTPDHAGQAYRAMQDGMLEGRPVIVPG